MWKYNEVDIHIYFIDIYYHIRTHMIVHVYKIDFKYITK